MWGTARTACISIALVSSLALRLTAGGVDDRLAAGGRSIANGRPAEARVDLQQALEAFRKKGNATGEAVTLMLLATAEVNLANDGVARGHLQDALHILRKRKDLLGTWLALVNLAQLERATGHYADALVRQGEAWRIIEQAESEDTGLTLAAFELMQEAFGLPGFDLAGAPTGMEDFLKAILLSAVLKPLTHNGYAGILIETGQYERAERELDAARAAPQLFSGGFASLIAVNLGELRYRQRRFAEARVHYEEALGGTLQMPVSPLGDQWIQTGIYGRMAELELAENHVAEALAWNDRALQAVRGAGNLLGESSTLEERGLLLLQGDRAADAEAAFEQAREVAAAAGDDKRQASVARRLAEASFLGGKYRSAVAHLEEGIRLQQQLHEPVDEGLLWADLAVLYMLASRDDAADVLLAQAEQLAGTSPVAFVCDVTRFLQTAHRHRKGAATRDELSAAFRALIANPQLRSVDIHGNAERALRETLSLDGGVPPTADLEPRMAIYAGLAYSNEARRQFENGNTAAARRLYEKALQANATGELRARYQAAIGACHWRDGNVDQAVRSFSDAAAALDTVVGDLRAESMLISFLGSGEHRAYYDVLVEALIRDHQAEKAFEVTERARARAFLRMGNGAQAPAAGTGSMLAKKLGEIERQIESWDAAPVPGETLDELRLRYDVLRSRIQSASAKGAGVEPLPLAEVWDELPRDTTLISYFVSPLGAHAWVVDSEGVEHVQLALDNGGLKRIVCWATELARETSATPARGVSMPGRCGSDAASPEEVYAALIEPLRGRIRNQRLLIVPHGDLHLVPFAALYDRQLGRYLVEDYTIAYLPSASALRLLRNRESPVRGCALVLGDPDASGRTALPGANREVQRVAAMLGTTARIGKDASEDLVYGLDGQVDLLHIAAHGMYDAKDPAFSALNLAAAGEWNGRLTVDEIRDDVDLSGVNLVVVTACQSGMGWQSGGDDVVGLTRALLYAGSPGVISALWKIDDVATTVLIEKFYARLLAGVPTAAALREAQLEMLRDDRYRAPHFWAAFLLTGDPAGEWSAFGPGS
jgi:CHAT domain-containing protein